MLALPTMEKLGEVVMIDDKTVYVDYPIWKLGRMKMCHMGSKDIESLHKMADKIGVARRHFQDKKLPHYDVCKAKRELAIKNGAVVVQSKTLVRILRGVL